MAERKPILAYGPAGAAERLAVPQKECGKSKGEAKQRQRKRDTMRECAEEKATNALKVNTK